MEKSFEKNKTSDKDKNKITGLKQYHILHSDCEPFFDNIAVLAARIFKMPLAIVSLVDLDLVFSKKVVEPESKKITNPCAMAILSSAQTVLNNDINEPCLLANPIIAAEFGLKFYAGTSILSSEGLALGTICILDKKERSFKQGQQDILQNLAQIAMNYIELKMKL